MQTVSATVPFQRASAGPQVIVLQQPHKIPACSELTRCYTVHAPIRSWTVRRSMPSTCVGVQTKPMLQGRHLPLAQEHWTRCALQISTSQWPPVLQCYCSTCLPFVSRTSTLVSAPSWRKPEAQHVVPGGWSATRYCQKQDVAGIAAD